MIYIYIQREPEFVKIEIHLLKSSRLQKSGYNKLSSIRIKKSSSIKKLIKIKMSRFMKKKKKIYIELNLLST